MGGLPLGDLVTLFMLRRVLQSIVVLLLVTVITFGLLRAIPGNPAVAVLGPNSFRNPLAIRQFDRQYGFDLPWYSQYWLWLRHLLTGNLGFSWRLNQSVATLLGSYLPKTIFLVGISTVLALLIAVPLGMIQAVRRNKFVDHFFNGFSTVLYAMPDFLIGILLILAFAIKIPLFPPEGPQGESVGVLFTNFNALILPITALTLVTLALFSRYMRSSVLDNLTEDYVRTAKAKGASERRVLIGHVLRNSLIPIVSLWGLDFAAVIGGGAILTESVFNLHGVGQFAAQSIQGLDVPPVLVITMLTATAVVVIAAFVDILYAFLDPRIRLA